MLQVEHEKKEEVLQKEIDRFRSEKTKLETERKMKQDRMVYSQKSSVVFSSIYIKLSGSILLL